jgi:hypothetical protein
MGPVRRAASGGIVGGFCEQHVGLEARLQHVAEGAQTGGHDDSSHMRAMRVEGWGGADR